LAPLFALILLGFIRRAITRRSVFETCTLAYTGLIFITPWLKGPRFFTVMLPLSILYLWEGIRSIGAVVFKNERNENKTRTPAVIFCLLCAFIICANLYGLAADNQINPWSTVDNDDYDLAMFAAPYLPEDAVVLAHDHCAFYLLTGKKSLSFTPAEQKFLPQYKLDAYLKRNGRVDYIAWAQGDQELVRSFLNTYGFETKNVAASDKYHLDRIVPSSEKPSKEAGEQNG